jgi:hypothetical protein
MKRNTIIKKVFLDQNGKDLKEGIRSHNFDKELDINDQVIKNVENKGVGQDKLRAFLVYVNAANANTDGPFRFLRN